MAPDFNSNPTDGDGEESDKPQKFATAQGGGIHTGPQAQETKTAEEIRRQHGSVEGENKSIDI